MRDANLFEAFLNTTQTLPPMKEAVGGVAKIIDRGGRRANQGGNGLRLAPVGADD